MPKDIASMSPHITGDGKYVVLLEYNCENDAIKVCEAESGRLVSVIPVTMLSFQVAALGMPPTGNDAHCDKKKGLHRSLAPA